MRACEKLVHVELWKKIVCVMLHARIITALRNASSRKQQPRGIVIKTVGFG